MTSSDPKPWLLDEVTTEVVERSHDGPDFDSRAELVTATELENMGVDWRRPSEPLETPHGRYTPDVMVGDRIIIEVKDSPFYDKKPPKLAWLMDDGFIVILVSGRTFGQRIPRDFYIEYGDHSGTGNWWDRRPSPRLEAVMRVLGVVE